MKKLFRIKTNVELIRDGVDVHSFSSISDMRKNQGKVIELYYKDDGWRDENNRVYNDSWIVVVEPEFKYGEVVEVYIMGLWMEMYFINDLGDEWKNRYQCYSLLDWDDRDGSVITGYDRIRKVDKNMINCTTEDGVKFKISRDILNANNNNND